MKYNFFYNGKPISRSNFESPIDWENHVVDGVYSWGYYKAIQLDENIH